MTPECPSGFRSGYPHYDVNTGTETQSGAQRWEEREPVNWRLEDEDRQPRA